jgi:tRNA-Thr(GGU) m(6)t(6)A37 methyltransferase TsaA
MDDMISMSPIGIIRTPFQSIEGMPIQPAGAADVPGTVEIRPEYEEGLDGLAGFSHIILLYAFHLSRGYRLTVKPFLDDEMHGVFATRAPRRPNPIGLSVVRLVQVEGCTLKVRGVDMVDGTPLLDVKPFVPQFDVPQVERIGWLEKNLEGLDQTRADSRFR